mmetsp:Transcript_14326/g.23389  ORF Transcript_14326/g.23389 Transcript_14326/m.23389 type:complete len:83 (+) Transcript_14326:679-927(+)
MKMFQQQEDNSKVGGALCPLIHGQSLLALPIHDNNNDEPNSQFFFSSFSSWSGKLPMKLLALSVNESFGTIRACDSDLLLFC